MIPVTMESGNTWKMIVVLGEGELRAVVPLLTLLSQSTDDEQCTTYQSQFAAEEGKSEDVKCMSFTLTLCPFICHQEEVSLEDTGAGKMAAHPITAIANKG